MLLIDKAVLRMWMTWSWVNMCMTDGWGKSPFVDDVRPCVYGSRRSGRGVCSMKKGPGSISV